jgi:hypothetical protein
MMVGVSAHANHVNASITTNGVRVWDVAKIPWQRIPDAHTLLTATTICIVD